MYKITTALAFMLVTQSVFAAAWQLDGSTSTLNFSSSKTTSNSSTPIVEENKFDQVTGTIDEKGNATITVDLNSVDTRVPLRDTRLKEQVFDTKTYPTATFTTKLDMNEIAKYEDKQVHTIPLEGTLNLHGTQHTIKTQVAMQELDAKTIQVKNTAPVVVDTSQFNMQDGVSALQALMALQSINSEIPVTFTYVFKEVD